MKDNTLIDQHREALAKRREITIGDLKKIAEKLNSDSTIGKIDKEFFDIAFNFLVRQFDKSKQLLEVAEMYRDQMHNAGAKGSMAWIATDKAIKDYYKINPCPHRLKYIKVIRSAINCETTVEYCPDCDTNLTEPVTDC